MPGRAGSARPGGSRRAARSVTVWRPASASRRSTCAGRRSTAGRRRWKIPRVRRSPRCSVPRCRWPMNGSAASRSMRSSPTSTSTFPTGRGSRRRSASARARGRAGMDYGVIWARSPDPADIDYAAGPAQRGGGAPAPWPARSPRCRRRYATRCRATRCWPAWTSRWAGRYRWPSRGAGAVSAGSRRAAPTTGCGATASGVRRDGSEPVVYTVTTRDIGLAGVTLHLKYHF